MTPHAPTTTRRARGGRGAALVEFALILPILALLIFGIIDFGKTFNDWQQLRQGTRQGARDGSVANFTNPPSCTLQGAFNGGSTQEKALACKVKAKVGLGDGVRVGFWFPDSGTNSWGEGNTLRVCTMYNASSLTGITKPFLDNKTFTAKVDIRIEQDLAAGQSFGAIHEPPLGGGTSWPGSCGS